MTFERLTWSGLLIVACGWALLFTSATLQQMTGRSLVLNFEDIAHYSIVSGFGLAILGALQSGFGALNRFFESVLQRTTRTQAPHGVNHQARLAPPKPLSAPSRKQKPKKIAERGRLKDRAYVLFMDGTVEIETLLGLRQFPSLREARDFVG